MNRDAGLEEAIGRAGGIGPLARGLGISQPSVSTWRRVPAERVLAVESLTGVARDLLRPDLYPSMPEPGPDVDETDQARAQEYALLAALLLRAPTATVLAQLSRLQGDATPLGLAHIALAEAATATDSSAVQREFFELFIGVGRGELLPYASYYLTGFLNERPLANLRGDLARLGLARPKGRGDPEDHIGTLCEVMSGMASRRFPAEADTEQRFFARHIAPWGGRFFLDLEMAKAAEFYRAVGTAGRLFLEIEAEAFAMEAET
jgi:TorA maturation chaperone TorD/DNA-binding transcriptional regulator YdaS (Cro superfamily)